jgi:hypothetical protein
MIIQISLYDSIRDISPKMAIQTKAKTRWRSSVPARASRAYSAAFAAAYIAVAASDSDSRINPISLTTVSAQIPTHVQHLRRRTRYPPTGMKPFTSSFSESLGNVPKFIGNGDELYHYAAVIDDFGELAVVEAHEDASDSKKSGSNNSDISGSSTSGSSSSNGVDGSGSSSETDILYQSPTSDEVQRSTIAISNKISSSQIAENARAAFGENSESQSTESSTSNSFPVIARATYRPGIKKTGWDLFVMETASGRDYSVKKEDGNDDSKEDSTDDSNNQAVSAFAFVPDHTYFKALGLLEGYALADRIREYSTNIMSGAYDVRGNTIDY